MKFNRIIFFNFFNNGDIHLSRGIVSYIIRRVKDTFSDTQFIYSHKRDPLLISDIEHLQFDKNIINSIDSVFQPAFIKDQDLFINTWYGTDRYHYMNQHLISFDCLYFLLNDVCKSYLDFSLDQEDPHKLFPKINFQKYQINEAKNYADQFEEPRILIANGFAESGQADNFHFTPIVLELANKYHGIQFLLTNYEGDYQLRENVKYTTNIIRKSMGSDLNENAYLGYRCNLIVGRASGVFSFCFNQDTLFHSSHIKMMVFSNLDYPKKFWLYNYFQDKINYGTSIINHKDNNALLYMDQFIQNGLSNGF